MCLRPLTIKNPSYLRSSYSLVGEDIIMNPQCISSSKEYIEVPCCVCSECRNTYYNSILQRGIVESLTSYLFFVTLTYDDNHIPSLTLPTGDIIYYSDYSHIQNMFKRFRSNKVLDREFRYLCVTEYGDKLHRPHFHLILFVQKKLDDLPTTPYYLETLLFDNLKRFYAVNIGTRKSPIYEPLFTYSIKRKGGKIFSNYFVKYVAPIDDYHIYNLDTSVNVKTLRYLLGYVSKGSSFDKTILSKLKDISDTLLVRKLRSILTSRIRYSKGFGLGFTDDGLYYEQRSFVKSSFFTAQYSRLYGCVSISDILESRPDFISSIQAIIFRLSFETYTSLQEFRNNLNDTIEFEALLYVYLLFPNYISYIHNRHIKPCQSDCISYYFKFLHRSPFEIHTEVTQSPVTSSLVRDYIRKGVEYGILNKVPFLAFPLYSNQSYMPLCKFYRERYTTSDDIVRMYSSCGVSNYDEWLSLFTHYVNNHVPSKFLANELKHESDMLQHVKSPIVSTSLLDIYKKV